MRPFGTVKEQDIANEVRVIAKLCETNKHKNIVAVFRYGKFPPSYYFIDMELCDITLDMYIHRRWTPEIELKLFYFTKTPPPRMQMSQLWDIMEDITCGITFIHLHKEIHLDLKPRNGIYFKHKILINF